MNRPILVFLTLLAGAARAQPASLAGGSASMERQGAAARAHRFTYLRTPRQVRRFVARGWLVPVEPGPDLVLHEVSFPYARKAIRLFLRRLSRQYREACGEKLVVTSLTRPRSKQPRNASPRSVHPTGMAIDLRRSTNPRCRRWLEGVLLHLERRGALEATLERRPPHYHVAVFPRRYERYVRSVLDRLRRLARYHPRRTRRTSEEE